MSLCKYHDVFGKEKTGIHSIRFLNVAIVDMLFTMIAACLIALYFDQNVFLVFFCLMILAVLMHRLFCVNSTINTFLFGEVRSN